MEAVDDFARQRDASRRRLVPLMAVFGLLAGIVLARLVYLQVLSAGDYRQQLEDWLVLEPDYVQPLRGDIRDRRGAVWAQDVPSWQVEAYYGALDSRPTKSGRNRYVRALARRLQRSGQYPAEMPLDDVEEALHQRIAESWQRLSDLAGTPTWQLYKTADAIVERVQTIRQRVAERQGFEEDVEEQRGFHPVLKDLSSELANRLRLELAGYPWLRVHTSTSRQYADDPAVCHLVGHLRQVSGEDIRKDRNAGDELRRLEPGDRVGQDGVEYAAEHLLRGRRGKIVRNRSGDCLLNVDPVRGQDVHVTVDLALQRWIYEQLGLAVQRCPTASSAAAVVLDVRSREVMAVVSWPGYTRQDYTERYEQLVRDSVHRPLRFHAVADLYPPGSIVKPVTILAALHDGLVTPDETVYCTGYLYPNVTNAFRCWTTSRGIVGGHGPLNAQEAILHSCNVYCYTMGPAAGGAAAVRLARSVRSGSVERHGSSGGGHGHAADAGVSGQDPRAGPAAQPGRTGGRGAELCDRPDGRSADADAGGQPRRDNRDGGLAAGRAGGGAGRRQPGRAACAARVERDVAARAGGHVRGGQ
jgi:cell division protein FtsI/penicillin-binding protein 2